MFEAMKTLAAQRGWTLDPPDPGAADAHTTVTLTGDLDGVPVRIEARDHSELTSIAILAETLPVAFEISNESLGQRLAHLIGKHDLAIGDPSFDDQFHLVAADPDWMRRLLASPFRGAVEQLAQECKARGAQGFRISEDGVAMREYQGGSAAMLTSSRMLGSLEIVVETARALASASV